MTLSICHFIHDIYSSFFAPLLPLLVEKFSMTLAQAGFLSTIMQIPALFNPFIGPTTPVMLAIVQENAKSSPSTANGLFMMVSFISRSAIVVIVGIIADHIGLPLTYCISSAIGLIGIPFILILPKT